MKKLYKPFIYTALSLLSVLTFSCEEEDKFGTPGPRPVVSEITPAEAKSGVEVVITGINLKNVKNIYFGNVLASGFDPLSNTESSIKVIVPDGLTPGQHEVFIWNTGGMDKDTLIVIEQAPVISGTSSAKGMPGNEITISGSNLSTVSSVKFGEIEVVSYVATASSITTTIPENAVSGEQMITVAHPGGETTFTFTVDRSPVISSVDPSTGAPGAIIAISGVRFENVEAVKLGETSVEYTVASSTKITFTVPADVPNGKVTVITSEGSGTSTNDFIIEKPATGVDPVADPALVFFDFDGKNSWWQDAGAIENDAALTLNGTSYLRINADLTDWKALMFRNGKDNFPGETIGTDVANYVFKFDINVLEDITGGVFAWRLKSGADGDFFYNWNPWAGSGAYKTDGWITITIPVTQFMKDGTTPITNLANVDEDFGLAFNSGTSKVNVAIDNVRFEKIN